MDFLALCIWLSLLVGILGLPVILPLVALIPAPAAREKVIASGGPVMNENLAIVDHAARTARRMLIVIAVLFILLMFLIAVTTGLIF